MRLLLLIAFSTHYLYIVAQTPEFVEGELFIKVSDNSSQDIAFSSLKNHNDSRWSSIIQSFKIREIQKAFKLKDEKLQRIYLLKFDETSKTPDLVDSIRQIDYIEYVEQVPAYELLHTPNDLNPQQWSLAKIQAPQAWDQSTGSSNIVIAVVDDAVLLAHEDLAANIWINTGEIVGNGIDDDSNGYIDDINGWDAADNDNDPNPPAIATSSHFSHGTHCAGIAAGVTNNGKGIASIGYSVKIMAVKTKMNSTTGPSLQAPYEGVEYAIAAGADVISMSWGGAAYSNTYQLLIDAAYNDGILLIAAAGNNNTDIPMYPASYNHIISVGATDRDDAKASFSNFGTTIDVMAPGLDILSTVAASNSSYDLKSGTSMACPLVSGICALMKSFSPTATAEEIEACLVSSCDNIDNVNPGFSGLIGAGRVNALHALTCLQEKPAADFSSNFQNICPGIPITFSDRSSGFPVTSWTWTFPGGNPASSSLQNPSIVYAATGAYNVTLIAGNIYGSDTIVKSAFIHIGSPMATFHSTADTVCKNSSSYVLVELTGSPPWALTYQNGTMLSTDFGITSIFHSIRVAHDSSALLKLISVSDSFCSGLASDSIYFQAITCCEEAGKQNNNWLFGYNAGISFNTGSPVAFTNSPLQTREGCASISDKNGALLFFTDGITVWDANLGTMLNGFGLTGDQDATQAALIIQKPQSDSIYYIFTSASHASPSFDSRYSIGDMSLNGGLGAITAKNIFINNPMGEKATAVFHANGIDLWVITHGKNNNNFYCYLVTDTGVNLAPVVSSLGTIDEGFGGYLKASPDGKKIAAGYYGVADLFDFDNATGLISNHVLLANNPSWAHGLEFSPNSKLLYVTSLQTKEIYQYDLSSGNPATVVASRITVGTGTSIWLGALLLAPDRKIYSAGLQSSYLGIINAPDSVGIACNYVENGIYLLGKRSGLGLPNTIKYPNQPMEANFTFLGICLEDSIRFSNLSVGNPDSVIWIFGDTVSGSNNVSNFENPKHLFTTPGEYTVKLITVKDCLLSSDTIIKTVSIKTCCSGTPSLQAAFTISDSIICLGDSVRFINTTQGTNFIHNWNFGNGASSSAINPYYAYQNSGSYNVVLTIADSCGNVDSLIRAITVLPLPFADFNDTSLCDSDSIQIGHTPVSDYAYHWSPSAGLSDTASANPWVHISSSSSYLIKIVSSLGCVSYDTITLTVITNCSLLICDDNNCNTLDYYDPVHSMCMNAPIPPPGCDDNNCNTIDAYDTLNCACINIAIPPPNCDDNDCNTADFYDSLNCSCIHNLIPAPGCDDNNCNTIDAYDTLNCACINVAIPPPGCDDNDCNTADFYDSLNCACIHNLIPVPGCDDLNCNTADDYDSLSCQCIHVIIPPVGCDDHDCNTVDSFDSLSCVCVNAPLPPPICDDSSCHTADTYNPLTCSCQHDSVPPLVAAFGYTHAALTVWTHDSTARASFWLWDFGDGATAPTRSAVHTYSAQGAYQICLTVGDGCVVKKECITVLITNTDVLPVNNSITVRIVPNPFSSSCSVVFNRPVNDVSLFLFDMLGREVRAYPNQHGNFTIHRNDLSNGMYLYQISVGGSRLYGKLAVAEAPAP